MADGEWRPPPTRRRSTRSSEVLAQVRRAKTEAKVSQRATVARLDLLGPEAWLAEIEPARADLVEALTVETLTTGPAGTASMAVELAPA